MFVNLILLFAKLNVAEETPQKMISYFNTYTNEKRSYEVDYPDDWKKMDGVEGFDLFLIAPNFEDKCEGNLSIISGEIPQGIDLKVYAEENMKNLVKSAKIKVEESGETVVAGISAFRVKYIRDDHKLEIEHYFFIKDGVGYLITTGAVRGCFDKYEKGFQSIIRSFRFN